MSERTLWKWLNKKMADDQYWAGIRLEKCLEKGIPDAVIRYDNQNDPIIHTTFMELKDWSESPKHPLSVEQKNFIQIFGGVVLIKAKDKLCVFGSNHNLIPLMSANVEYALSNGIVIPISDFTPAWLNAALTHCEL